MFARSFFLFLAAAILFCAKPLSARPPTFQHEILPLFEERCIVCHGEAQKMGGLDLRSIAAIMAGGSSGPALLPGDPDASLLWKQLETGKMPLSGEPFKPEEMRVIRAWIEQGRFPSMDAALDEKRAAVITDEARNHWAFQPPDKTSPPTLNDAARVRTPIDAFLLAELERKTWSFSPDADRRTMIRRAYLDLTGLPPSPEEVDTFVAAPDPRAYEKLVDKLLDSPHYGERWGRHWLDVAGYSDSVGNAADELRPVSWEYRDWVIQAFNDDKPFDRFLLEQIAGDQLVNYRPGTKPNPEHIDELIATGFLRLPPDISDTQSIYQVDKWYDALQTTVETSMKAVMGLTFGCARCHDHRFDPILQEDYYKLTAVYQAAFDPENWVPAALGFGHWPVRYVLDAEPEHREAYIQAATNDYPELRKAKNALNQEYRKYRNMWREESTAQAADADSSAGEALEDISNAELEKLYPELASKGEKVRRKERWYREITPRRIWAAWDVSKEPSPTYLLIRGNYLSPGPPVPPGVPAVLDDPDRPFQFPEPRDEWHHTGRRLALAKWLTRPDHPLTARVFVNRVWQYHFGEGIVRTPDDFGTQGSPPTHPELLDWLAAELVSSGWSLKHVHRQILASTTWQQDSQPREDGLKTDAASRLLWRFPPRRLEAEAIRDCILAVTGKLDLKMGGPGFSAFEVDLENVRHYFPKKNYGPADWRRMVYMTKVRQERDSVFGVFDCPDGSQVAPKRSRSTTPLQALNLLNSRFVMQQAEFLASRLQTDAPSAAERITRAWKLCFGRSPDDAEIDLAQKFVSSRGWTQFCRALLNTNEFLFVQ